jgi:GntR family transcriptional regulator
VTVAGPRPIDRASAVPRWAQIESDLRRRLAAGEFTGRLPTEGELVAQYDVSRSTVRQAVQRLRDDGLLESRQGAGTFLADPAEGFATHGISSLALTLRALGMAESSVVRAQEIRPAGAAGAELGLRPSDPVLYVERLRLGDGEPLALDRSWLPAAVARPLLKVDLTEGSLYGALARHCGIRVTGGREHLRPAEPTAADRRRLRLPRGEAVLVLERLALADARPVELRRSRMRGDRFELFAAWGERPRR